MAPEVREIPEYDAYELGAEIDGVWISFARIQGEQVRAIVSNVKENEQAAQQAQQQQG